MAATLTSDLVLAVGVSHTGWDVYRGCTACLLITNIMPHEASVKLLKVLTF